jgi:hypothetical protein
MHQSMQLAPIMVRSRSAVELTGDESPARRRLAGAQGRSY